MVHGPPVRPEVVRRLGPARDHRRHLADPRLLGAARGAPRRVHDRRPGRLRAGVPREGPVVRGPRQRQGLVHEPRHRRDPRADRVPRQLPVDDRAGDVHHQRHRARRRDAAGALPGRLHHGAEGRDEAGLRRQPHALARVMARDGDRQEGHGQRPHRPQAQAAGHHAPARAARGRREHGLRDRQVRRGAPRAVRRQPVHPHDPREGPGQERGRGAGRGVQEAAPGRAAHGRELAQPRALALLRPQALRPDEGRPLQAEHAPRAGRLARLPRAHHGRHRRAHPAPRRAPGQAERARGLQGLRGRRDHHPARPRSSTTSTSTSTSATGACAPSAS